MKRFLTPLALAAMLALGSVTLLTGCASAEKTAYTATSATYTTVDAAMTAWGAYVAQFHPGVNMESAVKRTYEQYQAAARGVADAGLAYRKAVDAGGDATGVKASLKRLAHRSFQLTAPWVSDTPPHTKPAVPIWRRNISAFK